MERYLLFDAGCAVCNQLAEAIEEAAAGKLKARSIRDPQAREWLEQAYPEGWAHQPYLVTVDGEWVQAYAGTSMALRLGRLLGPRQAWRVWHLARQYGVVWPAGEEFSAERRGFLKRAALFVGGLFFFPRFGSVGGQGRGPEVGPADGMQIEPVTGEALKALKDRALRNPDVRQALGVTKPKGFVIWDERIVGSRASTPEGQTQQLLLPLRKRAELAFVVYGEATLEDDEPWTGAVLIDHAEVLVITQGSVQHVEGEGAARLQRTLQRLQQELLGVGPALQGDCSGCCEKAILYCALCEAGVICLCVGSCILLCGFCVPCLNCDYECGYCIGSGGDCTVC